MSAIEILGRFAASLDRSRTPPEQLRLARLRILDTIGLAHAAAKHPVADSLNHYLRDAPPGPATVLGRRQGAPPETAALINGVLAHARDFDDTFPVSVVHPGSTIVPAVLAAAERADAGVEEAAVAIVAGYEVAARLGAAAGRGFHARGFHATSVVGPIAAAAAAARVMKLGPEACADAMGLATSASGGLLAFLADGSWSKWLHTGRSAQAGLQAAGLAAGGFRGPRQGLEHRYGLYGAFLGAPLADVAALTAGLGSEWRGAEAEPKRYPCAHVIQPFLDGALALRAAVGPGASVKGATCRIAGWAEPIVAEPRPRKIAPATDLDAIASLPFLVAAALTDRRVDLRTLDDVSLGRADLRALAERVLHIVDQRFEEGFQGEIEIELSSGDHLRRTVRSVREPEAILPKFTANVEGVLSERIIGDLTEALLAEDVSIRRVLRLANDIAFPAPNAAQAAVL